MHILTGLRLRGRQETLGYLYEKRSSWKSGRVFKTFYSKGTISIDENLQFKI